MKKRYKDIGVNETFHRGKMKVWFPCEGLSFKVFKRDTGNQCKCIKQINYGNNRAVGVVYSISPMETVFVM